MKFRNWINTHFFVETKRFIGGDLRGVVHKGTNQLGWQIIINDATVSDDSISGFLDRFPTPESLIEFIHNTSPDDVISTMRHYHKSFSDDLANKFEGAFHRYDRTQDASDIKSFYDEVKSNVEGEADTSEQQIQRLLKLADKVIVTAHSLGLRKTARVPIIFNLHSEENPSVHHGSYAQISKTHPKEPKRFEGRSNREFVSVEVYGNKSSDYYILFTLAHELGHVIYGRLPKKERWDIYSKSRKEPSLTPYTSPTFGKGMYDAHGSGNEWFADYLAANVMKNMGMPKRDPDFFEPYKEKILAWGNVPEEKIKWPDPENPEEVEGFAKNMITVPTTGARSHQGSSSGRTEKGWQNVRMYRKMRERGLKPPNE